MTMTMNEKLRIINEIFDKDENWFKESDPKNVAVSNFCRQISLGTMKNIDHLVSEVTIYPKDVDIFKIKSNINLTKSIFSENFNNSDFQQRLLDDIVEKITNEFLTSYSNDTKLRMHQPVTMTGIVNSETNDKLLFFMTRHRVLP